MKFYVPDWDDRVDPNFDFRADAYACDREVAGDVYAHEILVARPPYDGLLVSRAVVERTSSKFAELQQLGAHRYLRLRPAMEVFGDCGAFSYVNEEKPWYDTDDVLEYYDAIGVDYGASVDHLVFSTIYQTVEREEVLEDGVRQRKTVRQKIRVSEDECRRRMELTLQNARDFLRAHGQRRYKFVPVGVAQGWTPATYADSVRDLLKMGYIYIAIGGLARSTATQVRAVLDAVESALEEGGESLRSIRVHLFAVAKLDLVNELLHRGVASIDSASYLRKAWLRSGQNYLGADGRWYTAIRVPQSSHPRVQEFVSHNGKSMALVREQESSCLRMLQKYNDEGLSPSQLDELLDDIVEYDAYLLRAGDDGTSLRDKRVSKEKYRLALEARPWEKCSCEVCRSLGIHVLIFRGTNRNKRRGFHNTWTFYQRLRASHPQSAVP